MGLIARFDFGPSFPAFRGRISENAATVAEILQDNDIASYAVGKWHLSPPRENQPAGPFGNWPLGKGFSRFYGFLLGSTDNFHPELVSDNHILTQDAGGDYILTRDLVDHAIAMLDDHRSFRPNDPFFMYFATPGMHAPHQADEAFLEAQRGRYDRGWDVIREERFQRQKELGLVPADATLPDKDPRVQPWDTLSDIQKADYARLQEAYAAMLTQTDHEIGRLIDELGKLGMLDNTVIFLLSDNGASQEGGINGSVNHTAYYNGEPETPEDIFARIDEIGGPDALANYPLGWSEVSNTPFPYFKQDAGGGGISVPFIAAGPGIADGKGQRTQYHFVTDLTPTILDLFGIDTPDRVGGRDQMPFDGRSMSPSFADPDDERAARSTQFYRMGHNRGIYDDGWMATSVHQKGLSYDDDKWSLFHVAEDFTLSRDLAEENPDKLQELKALWVSEGEKVGGAMMIDLENPPAAIRKLLAATQRKSGGARTLVLYPDTAHASENAFPDIYNRDFTITAPIDRPRGDEDGVLFAYGNHDSGLTLYLRDGRPVFEYNYFSNVESIGKMYRILSDREAPEGQSEISVQFRKTGDFAGVATLYINGTSVGSVEMPSTIRKRMSHEGFDIGRDTGTAVGSLYEAPDAFEGQIENVTISIGAR